MAVNFYGQWSEEKDYANYDSQKWCDYDRLCCQIREDGHIPQTSMSHLLDMIFDYVYENYDDFYECAYNLNIEKLRNVILGSGGYERFDYWL